MRDWKAFHFLWSLTLCKWNVKKKKGEEEWREMFKEYQQLRIPGPTPLHQKYSGQWNAQF
ncbi:hypothetical protein [Tepidibacillus marianensis]|uniref:hypothetical protein n=1 Tax=Tepidibacillus marianensis TaxID=3131995 RepID=UPI0030CFD661